MASSKISSPSSTCSSSDSGCGPTALSLGKLPLFGFLAMLFMLILFIGSFVVYRRRAHLFSNGEWVQSGQRAKIDSIPTQPQLFERHLCSPVSNCGSKHWDTIMPLAVKYKFAPLNSELADRAHEVEHTLLPIWRTSSRTFRRQFAMNPSKIDIALSEKASRSGVEIAYIISMPAGERPERLFEIGVVEVNLSRFGDK
ncbi:hypothetical protein MSAN_01181800 [Mycena sanguinolenta]|uniref:Uncharacterized protein n=1 Tax=Mycena sanguinolenta TaxID=230812 RepID=A0A8H6YHY3_9AGAR|nr:hypothetical protein MSAN_01181800 [Mycena sanguinolenta]